jgi:hypothetical protein
MSEFIKCACCSLFILIIVAIIGTYITLFYSAETHRQLNEMIESLQTHLDAAETGNGFEFIDDSDKRRSTQRRAFLQADNSETTDGDLKRLFSSNIEKVESQMSDGAPQKDLLEETFKRSALPHKVCNGIYDKYVSCLAAGSADNVLDESRRTYCLCKAAYMQCATPLDNCAESELKYFSSSGVLSVACSDELADVCEERLRPLK